MFWRSCSLFTYKCSHLCKTVYTLVFTLFSCIVLQIPSAVYKGTSYAFSICFKSSWLTNVLWWQNTTAILKPVVPLPDGFACRWISIVRSPRCSLHANNRFQFNDPGHALHFHLRSVHCSEDAYHICGIVAVLYDKGCTRTWCQPANINCLSCL
jgi:hypothetical protein